MQHPHSNRKNEDLPLGFYSRTIDAVFSGKGLPTSLRLTPPETESLDKRWERLYRPGVQLKEAVLPAYIETVVPILISALQFAHADPADTRILTIGGGDGFFSRHLLPALVAELHDRGEPRKITVLETDIHTGITKAPVQSLIADVHELSRKVPGNFDLVVGESMIHQGGPATLKDRISEIGKVLSPRGMFVHMGDSVPNPGDFASAEELEKRGIKQTPVQTNVKMQDIAVSCHTDLGQLLCAAARKSNFNSLFASVGEEKFIEARPDLSFLVPLWPEDKVSRANTLAVGYGVAWVDIDEKVPQGSFQVKYGGFLFAMARPSISEFWELLDQERSSSQRGDEGKGSVDCGTVPG